MPLFGNQQQNQGTAVWEPQAADGRLAQTAGANPAGVFTSDLSVSEYVLLGEAGFEPAARRRAQAARHHPQAHLHPRPGQLTPLLVAVAHHCLQSAGDRADRHAIR
jgi:hypothetical protein